MPDTGSRDDDGIQSSERRAVLSAISKYATIGAGASVVVLSAKDAVAQQATSNCPNGTDPPCNQG